MCHESGWEIQAIHERLAREAREATDETEDADEEGDEIDPATPEAFPGMADG